MRIDFQEVKARVPIEEAAKVLLLDLKENTAGVHQFRASCPQCMAGGNRAIAVTPGHGYFCNADKRGGDVIGMVAHIQGVAMRQAAEWLVDHFQLAPPDKTPPPKKEDSPPSTLVKQDEPKPDGLQPLKNLDTAHEAVKALKLPQEVAEALGAGYCSKGLMKGYTALPLRLPTGKLIGYIGVTEGKLPTKWSIT